MEMESSDQTDIWRRSFESHAEEHPYASALIALHFARFNRKLLMKDPSDPYAKSLEREIDGFVSGMLGIDASEPENIPLGVKVNLRLLQVGDIISLALCHGWESMEIPDVPVDYEGNSLSLVLKSRDGFDFTLSPYPFSEARLALRVEARKLAEKTFTDDGDLRISLADAPRAALDFTIRKG
jgi:hypothetical protein